MNRSIVRSAPRLVIHVLTALAVVTSALAFNVPTPAQAVAAAPTVRGITPSSGLVGGGQAVLIWGTGFATSGTITVTINGVACTGAALALAANATAVKCTTGASTKGIGNVVVTNPDTQSGTLTNGFTYFASGDNDIATWGRGTISGNGENYTAMPLPTALDMTGAVSAVSVVGASLGAEQACAVASNNKAYCWGTGSYGSLGQGTTDTSLVPVGVSASGVLSGKSVVQISAGKSHSCAVTSEGKAYCWGWNGAGQLGNNSTTDSNAPVAVSTGAMTSKVIIAVAVNSPADPARAHTCALTSDLKMFCWGANASGQLGNNSTTNAKTAVAVNTSGSLASKSVAQIAVADSYSCALTTEGIASCWGTNDKGQLGKSGVAVKVPQAIDTTGVLSGKTLTNISTADTHACATSTTGAAYCWGASNYGQLGDGTSSADAIALPVAVDTSGAMSGATITSVAAGGTHTCASASNNKMFCWGDNSAYQTGQRTALDSAATFFKSPVEVDSANVLEGKRVVSISTGSYGSLAFVTKVGSGAAPGSPSRLMGWGKGTEFGAGFTAADQLISPNLDLDPNDFLSGTTVAAVSGKCLLTEANTIGCWGTDTSLTALNTGAVLDGLTISKLAALRAGQGCLLTTDNQIFCWGSNGYGELGNGTRVNSSTPVAVDMTGALNGKTITDISVGEATSSGGATACVLTSDDGIYCWGQGGSGQLGTNVTPALGFGYSSDVPVAVDLTNVTAGSKFSSIIAGSTSCVITTAGVAYCWGDNGFGNLGSGSVAANALLPEAVSTAGVLSGKTLTTLARSYYTTCALDSAGAAYCWGNDASGQRGDGNASGGSVGRLPVAVDVSGVLAGKTLDQISVGMDAVCAVDTAGAVYCWGNNMSRQAGQTKSSSGFQSPVRVNTYGFAVDYLQTTGSSTYAITAEVDSGVPAPTVTSVSPSSGLSLGGTSITITGTGFATSGSVGVKVGGDDCTSVSVTSETEITCVTPAHAGGDVDVVVTNPDNKRGTGTKAFTYIGPPTITSVSPSAGPEAGGTSITITGTGYLAGATVTVGGVECTSPSVDSEISITCTTGAHAFGVVNVVVTNTDTQTGTGVSAFTYGNAVTAVAPEAGSAVGGTAVTLTGTGFVDGATVTIGGTACTSVAFVDSTSITCTTPAGTIGLADVVVTNPSTATISGDDLFEYIGVPTISSVSPASGPAVGDAAITISGTNFDTTRTVAVTVGGSACTDVEVTSSTTLTCNTPAGSVGTADVVVTNPFSVSGSSDDAYTYIAAPVVSSVLPTTVSTAGGTTITITGSAFATSGTVLVKVGDSACTSVTVVSATSITCSTPATAASTVGITVENPDGQKDTEASLLTFAAAPTVTSVSPVVGPIAGSTSVTVTGTGFATVGVVVVKIDGVECTSVSVTLATSLTCTTPAGSAGAKTIEVTNPSALSGSLASAFRYVANPTITSVDKTLLPIQGGNRLAITGTGFDTEYLQFGVKIGSSDCLRIVVSSETSASCTVPAGSVVGPVNVVVTNLAITAEATLYNGIRYEDAISLINRFFPPPSAVNSRLLNDVKKITDARGNCSKDVTRFNKEVLDQVTAKLITADQAKLLQSFYTSLCSAQLTGSPAPSALPNRVRVESVGPLGVLPDPACSASFSTPSTALDFAVPDATITTFDYSRTDFEFAAMWVRSGEGEWSLGVTLDPANGGATGLVWSSDFVRALMYLAGIDNLSAQAVYNLHFAVGPGGTGDTYDDEGVVCSYNLSVFVGEIPATGTNTSVPTDMAVWFLCLGLGLAIIARRRHRVA